MLAQCLKMISKAYNLNKIWAVDEKCLRGLPANLPCYSNEAFSGFQLLGIFALTRDMATRKGLPSMERQKPLNMENLTLGQ